MASQFFVKKALENKFGSQIAEFGSSMLVADKKKQNEEESSPTRASPFVEGGLLDFIVMPSVSDLKQVVRDRGGKTLKEIKSVADLEKTAMAPRIILRPFLQTFNLLFFKTVIFQSLMT